MRTTQKQLAKMFSDLRKELGVRTSAGAWDYFYKASARLKRRIESRYEISGVQLTPYVGGTWRISGFDNLGCDGKVGVFRNPSMEVSLEDWMDNRTETIKRFANTLGLKRIYGNLGSL